MSIEEFIDQLGLPEASKVDSKVFKRLFYEHGELKSVDKKLFSDDVDEIIIRYTLTPETIPIRDYQDDDRVYDEIAVMQVKLRRDKPAKRIAEIIQRSIPYPLIILFNHDQSIMLNLADKRLNKADSSKLVIESMLHSPWLDLSAAPEFAKNFLQGFSIRQCRFGNLYQFYQDWMQAVLNLNASQYVKKDIKDKPADYETQHKALQAIDTANEKINELRSKLKSANQLNEKMQLNVQIKAQQQKIEQLKQQL
ncbi:MAG: DUF4391 domain-containing protein [Methylophaga sp.]|nr:DUF4391 domain-containing protein [Methylophaga sp.]